jgi:hypothetical protein
VPALAKLPDLSHLLPNVFLVDALTNGETAEPKIGSGAVVRHQTTVDVLGEFVLAPWRECLLRGEPDLGQLVILYFLRAQRGETFEIDKGVTPGRVALDQLARNRRSGIALVFAV